MTVEATTELNKHLRMRRININNVPFIFVAGKISELPILSFLETFILPYHQAQQLGNESSKLENHFRNSVRLLLKKI